jgi:hypothetical protein
MITFKQYLEEKTQQAFTGTSGCYCSMLLSPDSVKALEQLCKSISLPFTETEEIHCTVIYSPDDVPKSIPVPADMPIIGKVTGFELFGPDKDCLVALIDSPELATLNKQFIEQGAVSTYPEYRPHVTVAKVADGNVIPAHKPFSPIVLKFVSMTIEDITKKETT